MLTLLAPVKKNQTVVVQIESDHDRLLPLHVLPSPLCRFRLVYTGKNADRMPGDRTGHQAIPV